MATITKSRRQIREAMNILELLPEEDLASIIWNLKMRYAKYLAQKSDRKMKRRPRLSLAQINREVRAARK